jgi:hypothetical protein
MPKPENPGKSGQARERQTERGQDVIRYFEQQLERTDVPPQQLIDEMRQWMAQRESDNEPDEGDEEPAA